MTKVFSRAVVVVASALVPPSYRERFREEWLAEIWYEPAASRALIRSFGSILDAVSTRKLSRPSRVRPPRRSAPMPLHEFRYAFRSLRTRPFRTAVVLATLAIAIGANTAMFSLLHAVLLQPLAYPESDRLVKIEGFRTATGEAGNISPADFYDLELESGTLESMGAHGWVGFFTITGDGTPERVAGSNVTAGFLTTLGVAPALGRLFEPDDDVLGAAPTTVITDALWRRRFGAKRDVIGQTVDVNAVAHQIVGVLPPSYKHPEPNPEREPALYVPYRFERGGASRSGRFIRAVGRLASGRTAVEAESELVAIAARLEETHPDTNTDRSVSVQPLKYAVVKDARTGLYVLLGAVVSLLLIACANIANLQLARGSERRHELAIKVALGAGRAGLVRQLALESLMLSSGGAILGIGLAYAARGSFALSVIPRGDEVAFNLPVLLFTFAVSTVASVLFGLLPAMALSAGDLRKGFTRSAPRQALVACEVAIAFMLLVVASLLLGSLSELRSVAPGFMPDRVLTMQVSLPIARYEEGEQIPFYEELYGRLGALPGVSSVGGVNILPLSQNYSGDGFQVDARPVPHAEAPSAEARSVGADYFEAMGIPLLRGRLFDASDGVDGAPVVVISEAMAKRFWPGADALGERMTYNRGIPDEESTATGGPGSREVVGIVGDVKHLGLDDGEVAMFYTPQAHQPSFHTMTLVLRTSLPPESLTAGVRTELSSMDDNVPLYAVRSLDAVVETTIDEPRLRGTLLASFAAVALVLALLGVYAVIGISVDQRTREIGIRTALGAHGGNLISLLLRQNLTPVAWGLAAGVVGALVSTRFLQTLVFNMSVSDPLVYVSVASFVAVAATAAAAIPVLRALAVDPVEALRVE